MPERSVSSMRSKFLHQSTHKIIMCTRHKVHLDTLLDLDTLRVSKYRCSSEQVVQTVLILLIVAYITCFRLLRPFRPLVPECFSHICSALLFLFWKVTKKKKTVVLLEQHQFWLVLGVFNPPHFWALPVYAHSPGLLVRCHVALWNHRDALMLFLTTKKSNPYYPRFPKIPDLTCQLPNMYVSNLRL